MHHETPSNNITDIIEHRHASKRRPNVMSPRVGHYSNTGTVNIPTRAITIKTRIVIHYQPQEAPSLFETAGDHLVVRHDSLVRALAITNMP